MPTRWTNAVRIIAGALTLTGIAFVARGGATFAEGQSEAASEGRAGFVVASIQYALSSDAAQTGACPNGMSRSFKELYQTNHPDRVAQRAGETDQQYEFRINAEAAMG